MAGDITFNKWKNDDGSENSKCRAWVNFDGASDFIRAAGNVSSVIDEAVGEKTINFITNMPDTNYALVISGGNGTPGSPLLPATNLITTVSSIKIATNNAVGTLVDRVYNHVVVFR